MRTTLMTVVWVMALAASSGTRAEECNRACLTGLVDRYVAGMLAHDPHRVPWAAHVKFTENNVPMRIGDGLWGTIDKLGEYKVYFADTQAGQVGFYGVVSEGSKTSVFGLRMKVEDGKISEAETIVARPRETRPDFPNPGALKDKPLFSEIEPVQQRATREQLIAIADSYFNTLQQNDGRVLAPFDKDCNRVEDGVQTTNNPQRASSSGNGFPALGCEAQFKTGYFHFVTRIRDRRFPVVDVERGLVLVATFFDHTGALRKVTLSDGKTRDVGAPFDAPYSFVIFELFKVRDGKIRQVEAVLEDVPYSTQSAWVPRAPSPPSVEEPSAVVTVDCDRGCLDGFADRYMAALVEHDPSRLPWTAHPRFTENNVPLPVGEGLWNTIDKQGEYKLYFADPQAGQAGFYGTVEENGHAAVFSLRLKIVGHRIAEVETVVVRKTAQPFASPETLRDKPILSEIVPPEERLTREQLISVANGYFATLQQNNGTLFTPFDDNCNRIEDGTATTHNNLRRDYSEGANIMRMGCAEQFRTGFFRYVTRIRDRRFMLADEERGLIWAGALFDHAGVLRQETLTDGRRVAAQFEIPWSWLIAELFKVKNGKLIQVEALVLKVPYNTPSVWR